jgi:hypothetical protein
MADTLEKSNKDAKLKPFQQRVTAAVVAYAISIRQKEVGLTAHRTLALAILKDPDYWGRILAQGITSDGKITAEDNDKKIQDGLVAIFDAYCEG